MNLARSTYYEEPTGQRIEDAVIVEMIGEICAEFPCYGYRRVIAQLRREVDTPGFAPFNGASRPLRFVRLDLDQNQLSAVAGASSQD